MSLFRKSCLFSLFYPGLQAIGIFLTSHFPTTSPTLVTAKPRQHMLMTVPRTKSQTSLYLPSPSEIFRPTQTQRGDPLKHGRQGLHEHHVGIGRCGWLLRQDTDCLVEGAKRAGIGHWWIR